MSYDIPIWISTFYPMMPQHLGKQTYLWCKILSSLTNFTTTPWLNTSMFMSMSMCMSMREYVYVYVKSQVLTNWVGMFNLLFQESDGQLEEREKELKDAEKIEATAAVKLKSAKDNISAEEKRCKQIEKSIHEVLK